MRKSKEMDSMMKLFRHKWTIIGAILIAVSALGIFLGFHLNQEEEVVGYDLAIVDRQPMMLYEGQVYQYDKGIWTMLEYEEKIKQIFSGETLCFLDINGKIYYEGETLLSDLEKEGNVPLSSALTLYMTEKALALNAEQKFVIVNHNVENSGFQALLSDGSILYPKLDEYESFRVDDEIVMLSGGYILTESGNVYSLRLYEYIYPTMPEYALIYDGGDITYIDACPTANRGIGIREDGTAVIWSDLVAPDVSHWSNLVTAVHGFNYAAAVKDSGEVLFTHYDEAITADVVEYTSRWTDIVEIEAYYNSLYAVDREGNCFGVDFSSYSSVKEEGHCEEIDFEEPVVNAIH